MSYIVKSKSTNIVFGVVGTLSLAQWVSDILCHYFDPVIEQHNSIICETYDSGFSAPVHVFEI